ncbi:MAG TPA: CCC motif membrane protein [Bacteroidia bacterium]|jgi:hypothetical protein|nr:CCC motif membrane protein [Bacteroidia bacterium]
MNPNDPNDPNNPWSNNPYSPGQQGQNPNQPNWNQNQQNQQNWNQNQQNWNPHSGGLNQGQYPPPPPPPNPFFQNPFFGGQSTLPNAQAILVLGICSVVFSFCYGFLGVILGVIALVLGNKANEQYLQNPGMYTEASYSNVKAGRICGIVGLSLGALILIIVIFAIATVSRGFGGFY